MEVIDTIKDWVFVDPVTREMHPVFMNPDIEHHNVVLGRWYVVGEQVYRCVEVMSPDDIEEGTISYLREANSVIINGYNSDDLKERFSAKNVIPLDEYNEEKHLSNELEQLAQEYVNAFESGKNLMLNLDTNTSSDGEIYMPDLRPDDDPFEKVIKSMLRHMKVVLNDCKKNVEKPHIVDNLRSALSGATKNMSITKFLLWCQILQLDWEIRLSDAGSNVDNPIQKDIWVSNSHDIWVDIQPPTEKGIFVVPLSKDDDPLKRVVKLALDRKRINTKNCEDKCSSPHLINNMKSALKSKQKMTMLYFLSWCELLDLIFEIKVTDPKTNIYFQTIGFDLYTNLESTEGESEGTKHDIK